MTDAESIAAFLDRIRGPRKRVTVYGATVPPPLESFLDRFDVDVVHGSLPIDESEGYLTVDADDEFLGSVPAAAYADLLDPPRDAPWDPAVRESALRDFTDLFEGSAFTSVDRGHLLATTREFEDRAWRVGRGTLAAGFQSLSAFHQQERVYRQLADGSDLDVRVFADADRTPAAPSDLVVHTEPGTELGDFWFVAFDGGGDDEMACLLIAEEAGDGTFRGAWTYEPDVVRAFTAYLAETYGFEEQNG